MMPNKNKITTTIKSVCKPEPFLPLFTKQTCYNITKWYTQVLMDRIEGKKDD